MEDDTNNEKGIIDEKLLISEKTNYIDLYGSQINVLDVKYIMSKLNLDKINYLFVGNNNLKNIDLNLFANLTVLDISENPIEQIKYLPENIEELVCNNCNLNYICDNTNLKKLHCMDNKLQNIGNYINLNDLKCDNNFITKIKTFQNLKTLSCTNNPIEIINNQPNLLTLDCVNTNIENIDNLCELRNLFCENTKINTVSKLEKLELIEFQNTQINKIDYLPKLKHIIFNNKNVIFNSKYKIETFFEYDGNIDIVFV